MEENFNTLTSASQDWHYDPSDRPELYRGIELIIYLDNSVVNPKYYLASKTMYSYNEDYRFGIDYCSSSHVIAWRYIDEQPISVIVAKYERHLAEQSDLAEASRRKALIEEVNETFGIDLESLIWQSKYLP